LNEHICRGHAPRHANTSDRRVDDAHPHQTSVCAHRFRAAV